MHIDWSINGGGFTRGRGLNTVVLGKCTKGNILIAFVLSFVWQWSRYFLMLLSISRWDWSLIIVWPLSLFSSLLVSMAPLSHEIRPVTSCCPPHFGPAVPEVNSVWFKLFIYDQVKSGPPSLLLVKGTRLRWLPKIFEVTAVFRQKNYLGLQKALRDFVRQRFKKACY